MTIVLRADHRGFLCHCFCTHRFSRRAHGGDADDDDEGDADHGVSDSDTMVCGWRMVFGMLLMVFGGRICDGDLNGDGDDDDDFTTTMMTMLMCGEGDR